MATAFALFAGVLLPCWGAFPQVKKGLMKVSQRAFRTFHCWKPDGSQQTSKPGFTSLVALQVNGAWCSHHSECFSDCCLMNLDYGGTFCAPKARRAMMCLPQTKGAANIICPCQLGLACISKDLNCPRRCHLI